MEELLSGSGLEKTPIWFYHSESDTICTSYTPKMVYNVLESMGVTHNKITLIEGTSHNSFAPAINNPEVIDWIYSQQKVGEKPPVNPGDDDDDDDSGSISVPTNYTITVSDEIEGGSVSTSTKSAAGGKTVTIKIEPDVGYELTYIAVVDADGDEIALLVVDDANEMVDFVALP